MKMTSQLMTAYKYTGSSFTVHELLTCTYSTAKMQSFYSDILRENSAYIAGTIFVGLVYVVYSVCLHDSNRPETS